MANTTLHKNIVINNKGLLSSLTDEWCESYGVYEAFA